jgi:hypothetical protein
MLIDAAISSMPFQVRLWSQQVGPFKEVLPHSLGDRVLTLSLINAGLAQGKGRSGLSWWMVSLLLGPIAKHVPT